jgi:hypothetical protein
MSAGYVWAFTLMVGHLIRHQSLRPASAGEGPISLLRCGVSTALYPVTVLVGLVWHVAMLILYALLSSIYLGAVTP